ncbi:hypothetical protein [Arthrobacter nitrophenolicus]|nr:hypothetical protein [Arthrobacter nitrophenolicus]
MSRLFAASCAGVALTFTASPALAAHTDDGGNGAHVEQRELVFDDGSSYEYHEVVRHHGGYYNTTNSRDQWTEEDGDSFDWKRHYNELENVTTINSQTTYIDGDTTCRANSVSIYVTTAKGGISKGNSHESSECPEPAAGG